MANIVDPMFALKTSTVAPVPSVVPSLPHYEKAGETGTRTLWVLFAIMLLSALTFISMAWRLPVQKRLFHVLIALIAVFSTLSYFAMATGDGISFARFILKEGHDHGILDAHEHVFRQVYWARYIGWALSGPLILLSLSFVAGLNGANILIAIVAELIMDLTALFGSFGKDNGQKWGWYAMACIAYLVIVYQLVVPGRRAVLAKDNATARLYAAIGGYTIIVWALYAVVWGVGQGSRDMSVDSEIVAFAVLDILGGPVFGFWLLFAHARRASAVDGFWSSGLTYEGGVRLGDDEA